MAATVRGSSGRRWWRLGVAAGVTALAAVLFVVPRYNLPDPGSTLFWGLPSGPTVHVLISAAVAFVWGVALSWAAPFRLLGWGILFAFGAEALQFLPIASDRSVHLEDALVNVLGVGVGWGLAMGVRWACARREQRARTGVSR